MTIRPSPGAGVPSAPKPAGPPASHQSYERKVFRVAAAAAVGLHLMVIWGLLMAGGVASEIKYKPLAVMDFAYYDPAGGEPGGGEGGEPSAGPQPGPGEPASAASPPEPETAADLPDPPESEARLVEAEAESSEAPEVVTSLSEAAAPRPAPPPVQAVEAEAEAKPKSPPKTQPKQAPAAAPKVKSSAGGGAQAGEVKAGGGQGQGRGGSGGGQGGGNPNALKAYASKIQAKLNRLKKYPPAAAAKQLGGVATVNFTVNRQGQVVSSRLVKSSGQAALDQEAMALLKRCSPFPAMSKELAQNTLNLTVPISFDPPRK